MSVENLLMLVHRIPFPPNKGDKVRSFHILQHLTQKYRVSMGAFVDDPADWQYQTKLQALCADMHLESLSPKWGKLRSLSGLLSGEALSLPYYRSASMQQWVDQIIARQGISKVLIYSSQMAQYVLGKPQMTRIADFVDIDSDKWLQYGQSKPWPLSWVYAREGNKLRQFEMDVARRFDATTFVSGTEAADFRKLSGIGDDRVMHVNNGVNTDYFDPELVLPDPYQAAGPVLVFTGAMDYWPNIDAVEWFVQQILPKLRMHVPALQFYIAGARPTEAVLALPVYPPCHAGSSPVEDCARRAEQGAGGHGARQAGCGLAPGGGRYRGRARPAPAGGCRCSRICRHHPGSAGRAWVSDGIGCPCPDASVLWLGCKPGQI